MPPKSQDVSRKPFEKGFQKKNPENKGIFQQNFQHEHRRPLGRANALDVFERAPSLNKFKLNLNLI